jgi:hypothetical protein
MFTAESLGYLADLVGIVVGAYREMRLEPPRALLGDFLEQGPRAATRRLARRDRALCDHAPAGRTPQRASYGLDPPQPSIFR